MKRTPCLTLSQSALQFFIDFHHFSQANTTAEEDSGTETDDETGGPDEGKPFGSY